jgi:23S rRNA pseudouridine1911/1915/1917 synthase
MAREVTQTYRFLATTGDGNLRLDQLIARHVPGLSRNAARRVLAEGGVFVGKKRVKVASRVVAVGETVEVHWLPEGQFDGDLAPVHIPIVYEDAELVVIDKPEGVLSAPNQVSDRNNALKYLSKERGQELFLVHRLDRATSGLLLFAKTKAAAGNLSLKFQAHDLERRYLSLVLGALPSGPVTVDAPLDGRSAETRFRLRETFGEVSLVEAELVTGRTHQVRRHALSMGTPILGDRVYRPAQATTVPRAERLMLHAYFLGIAHPTTEERLSFELGLPDAFGAYIRTLATQIP